MLLKSFKTASLLTVLTAILLIITSCAEPAHYLWDEEIGTLTINDDSGFDDWYEFNLDNLFSPKHLFLADDVTYIPENFMKGNKTLCSLYMGRNIIHVSDRAFQDCSALSEIKWSPNLRVKGFAAFINTGITELIVPMKVQVIKYLSFNNCDKLERVIIPNSVTEMKPNFSLCDMLTDVELPESLRRLDDLMFEKCSSLRTITIPKSVKVIGYDILKDS